MGLKQFGSTLEKVKGLKKFARAGGGIWLKKIRVAAKVSSVVGDGPRDKEVKSGCQKIGALSDCRR
jgi:hypothetical protein